ncbi:MAG TPA: hypothetical protein VFF27_01620 [Bacteroidia bacterium]|jgi:hypothetical protein|nr:hypothetical protein [Bacteroidia bacterium]
MKKIIVAVTLLLFSFSLRAQDTIVVSIAHGSKPRHQFKDEQRTIGGRKGGHVVIEIDNNAYGFFFQGYRIHIFPHRRTPNGVFQKHTLKEWNKLTDGKKVTTIYIPVTAGEKQQLLKFYNENLKSPSYDYAFFGQRCASSAYAQLKSIHKLKGGSYVWNAFYPGEFRKTILKQNNVNQYRVLVKAGSVKRKWEGD